MFKWVEEGMYEEMVDMLQRESENGNEKIEVEDVKSMVLHLKEEMAWCKKELGKAKKKNMVVVVSVCLVVILTIYYFMFHKFGGKKLLSGL